MKIINKSSKREKPLLIKVTECAMRKFKAQLEQNNNTKRRCLEFCATKYYDDTYRFWIDFRVETERLLDSKTFERECIELGRNPQIVAEHLVYEGRKHVNAVLKNGLRDYKAQVMMFKEPIFVDTYNLSQEIPLLSERATA